MKLNKIQYKVLKTIYNNPHITHTTLKSNYFSSLSKTHFDSIVAFFIDSSLISPRVNSTYETDDGSERSGIDDSNCYVSLPDGDVIIEEHLFSFKCFIIPYAITTMLALCSLVLELLRLL